MNTVKSSLIFCTLLISFYSVYAQTATILNNRCGAATTQCVNTNRVDFRVSTPAFDPPPGSPSADPRQRFEAFWVTGDGNYILNEGSDQNSDALSLSPSYNYTAAGTYMPAAYLTGKYTNHTPPGRAVQALQVSPTGAPATPTKFNSRLKAANDSFPLIDIFSNHPIRKNNLTTFVISWPADVNASGIYLFYDGYFDAASNRYKAFTSQSLNYELTEVPNYFTPNLNANAPALMNTALIDDYLSVALRNPINGIAFEPLFYNNMPGRFRQFLFIPAENATRVNMPEGFTENRLFVVLKADENFVPTVPYMNFLVMLAGTKPNTGNPKLGSQLSQIYDGLSVGAPIATLTQSHEQQFVQAIASLQLDYLVTFDPNELRVMNIQSTGADEYEVSFELEMCNKGKENVMHQEISLRFPTNFHGFTPDGFTAANSNQTATSWNFSTDVFIGGVEIDANGYEDTKCATIRFKGKTDCAGLRSLWKSGEPSPVESCVLFSGGLASTQPECHPATGIDSTQFGCLCCMNTGKITDINDGNCWPLWLLLIIVVLCVIWWAYRQNNT